MKISMKHGAAILAATAATAVVLISMQDSSGQQHQSLRGDLDGEGSDGAKGFTKRRILKSLFGFDEDQFRADVGAKIKASGIGLGRHKLFSDFDEVMQNGDIFDDANRDLQAGDPCTTPPQLNWPQTLVSGNAPCDYSESYNRDQVKTNVDTILSNAVNGPGCLASTAPDFGGYGACGVPGSPSTCPSTDPTADGSECCICGFCLLFCLATICEDQCYENSLQDDVDTLVQHGVEVREYFARIVVFDRLPFLVILGGNGRA